MPPIANNSQRYSIEIKWLKKANPLYFEIEQRKEMRDLKLLSKKRDNLRQANDMLLQSLP